MKNKEKIEVLKEMIYEMHCNSCYWADPPDEATQDAMNRYEALAWAINRLEGR